MFCHLGQQVCSVCAFGVLSSAKIISAKSFVHHQHSHFQAKTTGALFIIQCVSRFITCEEDIQLISVLSANDQPDQFFLVLHFYVSQSPSVCFKIGFSLFVVPPLSIPCHPV